MKSARNKGELQHMEPRWKVTIETPDQKAQSYPGANGCKYHLPTLNESSSGSKSQRLLRPISTTISPVDLLSPRRKPASHAQTEVLSFLQHRVHHLETQISLLIEQNKTLIKQNNDFKTSFEKKIIEKIEFSRDSGNKKEDLSYAERSVHGHRKPSPNSEINKSISKSTVGQREPDQLAPPASLAVSQIDRKENSRITEEPSKGLTERTARESKSKEKIPDSTFWTSCFGCFSSVPQLRRVSPHSISLQGKPVSKIKK